MGPGAAVCGRLAFHNRPARTSTAIVKAPAPYHSRRCDCADRRTVSWTASAATGMRSDLEAVFAVSKAACTSPPELYLWLGSLLRHLSMTDCNTGGSAGEMGEGASRRIAALSSKEVPPRKGRRPAAIS